MAQRVPGSPIRRSRWQLRIEAAAQDIRVINKVSQICTPNSAAPSGARRGNAGRSKAASKFCADFDAGRDLERPVRFLRRIGTFAANLVAPHAIVQLLRYCSTQPWEQTIRRPFPIAGVDGS